MRGLVRGGAAEQSKVLGMDWGLWALVNGVYVSAVSRFLVGVARVRV